MWKLGLGVFVFAVLMAGPRTSVALDHDDTLEVGTVDVGSVDGETAVGLGVDDAVPLSCGDYRCDPPEDCHSCPSDCGDCCGNHRCEPPEDCNSCPQDCRC